MKPAPAPNIATNTEAERRDNASDRLSDQAKTIEELNARCDGPNQFENFDRAFCKTLTVSKAAVLKEEVRLKRARAKKRSKKSSSRTS